jgi:hypothetical protein
MSHALDSAIELIVDKVGGVGTITQETLTNLVTSCGYQSCAIQSVSIDMDGWLEDVIFYVDTNNVILYWLFGG